MSETVHYRGEIVKLYDTLMPLDKQLQLELNKVGSDFKVCNDFGWLGNNYREALEELQEIDDYFLYKNNLYAVSRKKLDPYNDIMSAHKIDEDTIGFEVKYYNGGCCFEEALEAALERL